MKKLLLLLAFLFLMPLSAASADHNVAVGEFDFGTITLSEKECSVPVIVANIPPEIVAVLKQGRVEFNPDTAKEVGDSGRDLCYIVHMGLIELIDEKGDHGMFPAEKFKPAKSS